MRRTFTTLLAALPAAALLLGGCAPAALAPVTDKAALRAGQVIIVGKVRLLPPLDPKEQRFRALNTDQLLGKIFLLTSRDEPSLKSPPTTADYADRIEAEIGKPFFVVTAPESFFLRAGVIFLDDDSPSFNKALLPGGMRVDVKPGDQAIYVGTIEYRRDEAFNILGLRVVDDYAATSREFIARFGTQTKLRKALITRP